MTSFLWPDSMEEAVRLIRELKHRNEELRKELTEAQERVRFWRNKANDAILDRKS